MERMERFQKAQRKVAADVEEQSNIGKKNETHWSYIPLVLEAKSFCISLSL